MITRAWSKDLKQQLQDSFRIIRFEELAPLFGMDPSNFMGNFHRLTVSRSHLPMEVLKYMLADISALRCQYGENVLRQKGGGFRHAYLGRIIGHVLQILGGRVKQYPGAYFPTPRNSRTVHRFCTYDTVTLILIEVAEPLSQGIEEQVTQFLVEADACDYANEKGTSSFWTPILGILTDGFQYYFLVFDSGQCPWRIYLSDCFAGLANFGPSDPHLLFCTQLKIRKAVLKCFT